VVACALLWTISRGFVGTTRRLDARAIVLGGNCWAHGLSPYVPDEYSRAWQTAYHSPRPDEFVFAYPPTLAILVVPLNSFGLDIGLDLFDALNVTALGAVLFACLWLMRDVHAGPWHQPRFALSVGLAAAVGALSGTLLVGQTGLLPLAAILGLWILPRERWRALRVACVVIATMKPSLTLIVLCFLAVTDPVLIALSAVTVCVLCVPVAMVSGGFSMPGDWLRALRSYAATPANAPQELASGQYLFARLWPAGLAAILTAVGALGGVLLGIRDRVGRKQDAVPAANVESLLSLLALSAACLPLHSYDMILIAPLAAVVPFVRIRSLWFPAGVLLVARPAVVARLLEAAGIRFENPDAMIMSGGTALLAIGMLACIASGRRLLASTSCSTASNG